jgi:FlaA1/EpsC-like NDP-sugar epimerase
VNLILNRFPIAGLRAFGLQAPPNVMNSTVIPRILDMSRTSKRLVALVLDTLLCIATVAFAYWLRLGALAFPTGWQWLSYAVALALALPLFITTGLYRAIFRYAAWGALRAIARACGIYGAGYCLIFMIIGVQGVPRSLGVLQPILLFLAIGSSRAWAHYWLGGAYRNLFKQHTRHRVLIYGAGSAGRQLAAGLANSADMQAVAFVDDDKTLHGSVLNGRRIYPAKNLADIIAKLEIDDVLLAIPSTSRQRRNEIIDELRATSATIRTLPGINDLAHGRVTVNDLRELDIEDLLGRDAVPPNYALLSKNIQDRAVLVTGAGGSIGSELCRQILALGPKRLILVDHSEFNLYAIDQDLQQRRADLESDSEIQAFLGSVRDEARMDGIFEHWKPDTVYHAAAYKHVPLVEENPAEGVLNNVFGTRTMAELAEKHGVSDFVLISTDKAVRPTNVMGATKRLAEMVLQAMAAEKPKTRFSMVRFGNVLGSSGSVVPLFRKQIAAGGPVTVTHQDITRYFMTIPEAAQLVIQAGAMAQGGEVFVLDMGEPVKIVDLARRMIELSGLSVRDESNPAGDIEIEVVGLRPAEKLYEELLIGDNPEATSHARIMKARDGYLPIGKLHHHMSELKFETRVYPIKRKLFEIMPEYLRMIEPTEKA